MRTKIPALLLVFTSFVMAGCRKDEEVKTILAAIDAFTTELVGRVESAPNPSAGVDDAQNYLDLRKTDIMAKMEKLKSLRDRQVSDETKQRLASSLVNDSSKVGNLQIKYASQSLSDPGFKAKLDKLVKDYQNVLTQ